jgi:hypothetical protein
MTGVGLGAKSGARNLETSHQLVCGKGDSDGSEGAIIQDQAETGGERFAIHEKFWTGRKNRSTRAKAEINFEMVCSASPFPSNSFRIAWEAARATASPRCQSTRPSSMDIVCHLEISFGILP